MTRPLRAGDTAVVLGLGLYGRAVAVALRTRGIEVVAVEDRPADDTDRFASEIGCTLVVAPSEDELRGAFSADISAFLPSPGVPEWHPAFTVADAAAVPTLSEFDLARWWDHRPIAAITGTDGKTTVTMLATAMLVASGVHARAVGNTDTPLIEAIDDATIDAFVVEASSFRLGHTERFEPRAAVWLNFGPDHLDVHHDLARYEEAKAAIWRDLPADGVAVAPIGEPVVERHLPPDRKVVRVDPTPDAEGWLSADGLRICRVDDLHRAFDHDRSNVLVAATLALTLGATLEGVRAAIAADRGLPHRVQFVRELDGVCWYNDSKATAPHAVLAACQNFDHIVLIAGGRNKGLDLGELATAADRLHAVIALGEAGPEVAEVFEGLVPAETVATMEEAVEAAARQADAGTVVLLSPGCASYDAYTSYGARGDHFVGLVEALRESTEPPVLEDEPPDLNSAQGGTP